MGFGGSQGIPRVVGNQGIQQVADNQGIQQVVGNQGIQQAFVAGNQGILGIPGIPGNLVNPGNLGNPVPNRYYLEVKLVQFLIVDLVDLFLEMLKTESQLRMG